MKERDKKEKEANTLVKKASKQASNLPLHDHTQRSVNKQNQQYHCIILYWGVVPVVVPGIVYCTTGVVKSNRMKNEKQQTDKQNKQKQLCKFYYLPLLTAAMMTDRWVCV